MEFNFDTDDRPAAAAAQIVYAVWRSRDQRRFHVTPDVWSQVERFCRAAAKRATTLAEFVERLKPRLCCDSLNPRWLRTGTLTASPLVALGDGSYAELAARPEQREFLTGLLSDPEAQRPVLRTLQRETSYVVLLVRDRLEREKPIEQRFPQAFAEEETGDVG